MKPVVIPKQGHEMGDSGWETTVMGEILKFMEKFIDGNLFFSNRFHIH